MASAPLQSALIALSILAVCGFLFVFLLADHAQVARELRNPETILNLIGAGVTLIAAAIAAFRIHVRGRTLPWRAIPLLIFVVWQGISIAQCIDTMPKSVLYSHSASCLLFILAAAFRSLCFCSRSSACMARLWAGRHRP
jgi:hypothetical protein